MIVCVTSDKEKASKIREAIKENNGYCPCQLEQNDDTRCMCKDFILQKEGYCHCGLYYKQEEQ